MVSVHAAALANRPAQIDNHSIVRNKPRRWARSGNEDLSTSELINHHWHYKRASSVSISVSPRPTLLYRSRSRFQISTGCSNDRTPKRSRALLGQQGRPETHVTRLFIAFTVASQHRTARTPAFQTLQLLLI
jgi:hypothetical protein